MRRRFSMMDLVCLMLMPRHDYDAVLRRSGVSMDTSRQIIHGCRRALLGRGPLGARRSSVLNIVALLFCAVLIGAIVVQRIEGESPSADRLSDLLIMVFAMLLFLVLGIKSWLRDHPGLVAMHHIRTRLPERARRGELDASEMTQVGAAIEERRRYWSQRLNTGPWGRSWLRGPALDGLSSVMWTSITAGLILILVLDVVDADAFGRLLPMIYIVGIVGFVSLVNRAGWLRRRCRSALRTSACADCGHGLESLGSAVDPALLGGCEVGPRTCPECGAPWPLVPAPVCRHLALERRRCPRCAVDLTDAMQSIDPSPSGRHVVGPATCPECELVRPLD